MGLRELKKELNKLDKKQLIDLVADLYKKNKGAKEYLDFYVTPNETELFEKYRDKVFDAFYPKRGGHYLNLREGKKAINDFKKLAPSAALVADLMLFYVETGVQFTLEFGDIDEAFYSSMTSTYSAALTLMAKEDLLEQFADRAAQVVQDTLDKGWGFHDTLYSIHWEFYPEH
ncbi:DUF6155 family protein [Algivirga pacifica]|uniref:Uncharacterized protein n=1 Tax=Algivirga pacifica TaxID=1162670 RepID=A0ABP9DIB9_9BACT